MTRRASAFVMSGSSRTRIVLAILVFVLVWLYRFNTLGGALAGFDNDHFLHFVYAKQVQAGEQPLRDFLDAGLQGARPSLTYELSAAAQTYLGNDLRSEAWLTVSGVALGAAVAFVAGSLLAPWPWAIATALLSALVSPKLYGYPKVVLLAVASLIIVRYAARPAWRGVAAMSVLTAIAFLFRHDYAVYASVGFVSVMAASRDGTWQTRATRIAGYALGTVLLLGPSLWWIQHYTGLVEYVRNGIDMSRQESYITRLDWPVPALANADSVVALLRLEANTQAWLYYVFLGLPLAAVVMPGLRILGRSKRTGPTSGRTDAGGRDAALLALGVMSLVLAWFFLRASLEGRFGDMAAPVAVLGAAMLATATARGSSRVTPWLLRVSASVVVLAITLACIWFLQSVPNQLYVSKIFGGPTALVSRTKQVSQELAGMPRSMREEGPVDRMQAADYLNRCTAPTDRVLVVAYEPELLAFSERLFAGDRATFVYGYYKDERYMRRTLASLETESVPVAFVESKPQYAEDRLLAAYLREHYTELQPILVNGGPIRLFARRGKVGHAFGPGGWPCFR